jgi:peptidoglycan/xylan/chitin deacetylase (PgdA/CDA1 family)
VSSLGLRGLKVAAHLADRLRPAHRGIVVLIYHRVGGGSGLQVDLEPDRFADQLALVADRAVTLDAALDELVAPAPHRPDSVVVTFDDGTPDVLEHALPRLVDAGVPALLYLATAFVDGDARFPGADRAISWSALADAMTTGLLRIGSHTHGHVLLDRLEPSAAVADIDRSIGLIEDRLGVRPAHFAYPKAVAPSAAIEAAVRERFRSAALAGTRPNRYQRTDPWRLSRSPVQVADEQRWFAAKVDGGMAFEDAVRVRLNHVRYRGAST